MPKPTPRCSDNVSPRCPLKNALLPLVPGGGRTQKEVGGARSFIFMARSKDLFARDPTPCTHLRSENDSLSLQPQHNGHQAVQPNILDIGSPSASMRNDTQLLARSTAHFLDSGDPSLSLSFSRNETPSKKHNLAFELSQKDRGDSVRYEPSRGLGVPTGMGGSALTLRSDKIGTIQQQSQGNQKSKTKIMPFNRRASRDKSPSVSVDLPRSSLDNDGLGIYANSGMEGRSNDPLVTHVVRKHTATAHHRSASGTSQFSTGSSSSMGKAGPQYIHPMRQAPRAYTPPLGQSYQASDLESDDSGKGDATDGEPLAKSNPNVFHSPLRTSSGQTPRLSLQIQESSFTRLPGTSQTNITGRSSFTYSRDNGSTLDTASPISRPSLDFVFRSKTRTSMDPVSRAATIQAARQAFEEKEAAKARKFEEQQMRAEQKNIRRREKQHWRASLRDGEANETGDESKWEKESQGIPHALDPHSTPSSSTPAPAPPTPEPKSGVWKSQSKNTWMHFLTWLRTRVFKLRRRVKKIG